MTFKMVVQKIDNQTGRYHNFGTFHSNDIDELYAMMETIHRNYLVFSEMFVRVNHQIGYVPVASLDTLLENVKDAINRCNNSHSKALKAV